MITLLTEPVLPLALRLAWYSKRLYRRTSVSWRGLQIKPSEPMHVGHMSVLRSVCDGLKALGVPYNWNPRQPNELGETVLVLTNWRVLASAIWWKKRGYIKKLLAGPTIVNRPIDYWGLVMHPAVDRFLVPSNWVREWWSLYNREFVKRIALWPGVDPHHWSVDRSMPRGKRLLFYKKFPPERFYGRCAEIARGLGFSVTEIEPRRVPRFGELRGGFTHEEYREALRACDYLVEFTMPETQGISMAEAWAADVPTLVCGLRFQMNDYMCVESATAPLMTEQTGRYFYTEGEFRDVLLRLESEHFSPRQWVLDNLTDVHSAKILLQIVDSIPTNDAHHR